MTVVADTRFLVVFTFPSTDDEASKARELMHRSLRERLVVPSIVVAEYVKAAGKKIGRDGALTRLANLKEGGATVMGLDERTAVRAGDLLLRRDVPIGDAIVAATALTARASHVLSDDPHLAALGIRTKWIAT
jgi:predicted nucleic acid-binding protein